MPRRDTSDSVRNLLMAMGQFSSNAADRRREQERIDRQAAQDKKDDARHAATLTARGVTYDSSAPYDYTKYHMTPQTPGTPGAGSHGSLVEVGGQVMRLQDALSLRKQLTDQAKSLFEAAQMNPDNTDIATLAGVVQNQLSAIDRAILPNAGTESTLNPERLNEPIKMPESSKAGKNEQTYKLNPTNEGSSTAAAGSLWNDLKNAGAVAKGVPNKLINNALEAVHQNITADPDADKAAYIADMFLAAPAKAAASGVDQNKILRQVFGQSRHDAIRQNMQTQIDKAGILPPPMGAEPVQLPPVASDITPGYIQSLAGPQIGPNAAAGNEATPNIEAVADLVLDGKSTDSLTRGWSKDQLERLRDELKRRKTAK